MDAYGNEVVSGNIYCVEFIDRLPPFLDGVKILGVGGHDCIWFVDRFRPLGGNATEIAATTIEAPPVRVRETENA